MGLTNWKNAPLGRIIKSYISIAKNSQGSNPCSPVIKENVFPMGHILFLITPGLPSDSY